MKRLATLIIGLEPLCLLVAVPVLVLPQVSQWLAGRALNSHEMWGTLTVSYLALVLLALPWLARWLRDGQPMVPTPLDLPVALYVVAMALGLWAAPDRAHSLTMLRGIVGGVAVYYGAWHWCRGRPLRSWVAAGLLVAAGVVLALLAYAQTNWTLAENRDGRWLGPWLVPLQEQLDRVPQLGTWQVDGSRAAGTLALIIPVAAALVITLPVKGRLGLVAGGWLLRLLFALAFALMLGYLLLFWSRGDLLALILAAFLALLWCGRLGREAVLGLGVGVVVAGIGLLVVAPRTAAALGDMIYPSRIEVWTRALTIIGDHPFTGAGLDSFRAIARNSYPYLTLAYDQSENAHSWVLQAGVDGGLLGVAAVLLLMGAFYRARLSDAPWVMPRLRGLHTGLLVGCTAFFLGHLWDDGTMGTPYFALLIWTLLGVTAATGERQSEPSNDQVGSQSHQRAWRWATALATVALTVGLWANWSWLEGMAYNNLASVCRNQGLYDPVLSDEQRVAYAALATATYHRALAAAPDLAAVHRNLGVLYYQAAHAAQAAEYIAWTNGLGFAPVAFFQGIPAPQGGYLAAASSELCEAVRAAPEDEMTLDLMNKVRAATTSE